MLLQYLLLSSVLIFDPSLDQRENLMLKKVKLQLQLAEEVFSKILMRAGFFYNQKRLIEFEKIKSDFNLESKKEITEDIIFTVWTRK